MRSIQNPGKHLRSWTYYWEGVTTTPCCFYLLCLLVPFCCLIICYRENIMHHLQGWCKNKQMWRKIFPLNFASFLFYFVIMYLSRIFTWLLRCTEATRINSATLPDPNGIKWDSFDYYETSLLELFPVTQEIITPGIKILQS